MDDSEMVRRERRARIEAALETVRRCQAADAAQAAERRARIVAARDGFRRGAMSGTVPTSPTRTDWAAIVARNGLTGADAKKAVRQLRVARRGVPVKVDGIEYTLLPEGGLQTRRLDPRRAPLRTITSSGVDIAAVFGLAPAKRRPVG